jgi:hypothetical protein
MFEPRIAPITPTDSMVPRSRHWRDSRLVAIPLLQVTRPCVLVIHGFPKLQFETEKG